MKKYWIPCSLTLINITCGILAVFFISKNQVPMAIKLLILAGIFDTIDGRIAVSLNATSDFGRELDSLADLSSFGVAPSFFLHNYLTSLTSTPEILTFILPVIFIICGAIRLARYNILNDKTSFTGLPIPVAGGLLILSSLVFNNFSYIIISCVSLLLSILMISKFKLPRLWV